MTYPPRPQASDYKVDMPPRIRTPILPCGVPQLERFWMAPAVHLRRAPPARVVNAPNLFPYRVAPGNDNSLRFCWKILHADRCLAGTIAIARASKTLAPPLWTMELNAEQLVAGELPFDGTINGSLLTVADSPYQVQMSIQTPGRRYRKLIYLEVVVADLRPRAPTDKTVDRALVDDPTRPVKLSFERRHFSVSVDESYDLAIAEDDLAYLGVEAWWRNQDRALSLAAEVLVFDSQNRPVPPGASAVAGMRLRWTVEPADDVLPDDHPHRAFVAGLSKKQNRQASPQVVRRVDEGHEFVPDRWAGSHSRVALSYHHGVSDPGPRHEPSVSGERLFVVWHFLKVASHTAFGTAHQPGPKTPQVLREEFEHATRKLGRAFIEVRVANGVVVPRPVAGEEFRQIFEAARDAVMKNADSELKQHRNIFNLIFRDDRLEKHGFTFHEFYREEGTIPFDPKAVADFEGDDEEKGQEYLRRLMVAARDDGTQPATILAELGVKFSKEIQERLIHDLIGESEPGVHIVHMPTDVPSFGTDPRFPGAYTVHVDRERFAVLFRDYPFEPQPDDSFGVTLAHECGHGLYLPHPAEAPGRHEPTADKCLMGYDNDRKGRELCGVCQLRLRGWGATAG